MTAATTGTRAAFGWYGSKARLAPRIAEMAAAIPHRVYVEPYAGSAAVLFRKPRSPVEIINDIDGQVVNFFRVLRDRPAGLARACRLTPCAREQYESDAECDAASDMERARRFWARCAQSFNSGGAGRRAGWGISAKPGSNDARSAAGLAAQLEAIAERLSGVFIEHCDTLDVIARYAGPDALVYADPPYLSATRTGQTRSKKRRLPARARRRRPPGSRRGAARHRRGGTRLRLRPPALRRPVRWMAPYRDPRHQAQRQPQLSRCTAHRGSHLEQPPAQQQRRPVRGVGKTAVTRYTRLR